MGKKTYENSVLKNIPSSTELCLAMTVSWNEFFLVLTFEETVTNSLKYGAGN